MKSREDVIKGLEKLREYADSEVHPILSPDNWDIYSELRDLIDEVEEDALVLLKAQEPRVMTLEEIIQWEGAFWLEFLEEDSDYYTRYGYALFCGSTPYIIEVIAQDGFRPLYAFIRSEYGVRWRCWTSRPDEATMEATPWE